MFDYILLASLKERRDHLSERIAVQESHEYHEAIETVRAFVDEHGLTKEDIYPTATKAKSQKPLAGCDGTRNAAGTRKLK